eukprot:gene10938-14687_t
MNKDQASLQITILKVIAKNPTQFLVNQKNNIDKLFSSYPTSIRINIVQKLVDYITEAGRLTDDILSPSFFTLFSEVKLRNSKTSANYILSVIDKCSSGVELVDVSGCFQVDDNCAISIINKCPNLKRLNLRNCRKLSSILVHLQASKINLEYLDIGGNINISKDTIYDYFSDRNQGCLQNIRNLNLSGLYIDNDLLLNIAHHAINLSTLKIAYCDISEDILGQVLRLIGNKLEVLSIAWLSTTPGARNPQINGHFLHETLALVCSRLEELDVSGLKNISMSNLMLMLERKMLQSFSNAEFLPLKTLHTKFIATPRAQIETTLPQSFPALKVFA